MTTYDIARSVANRMRNAAEAKKIRVIEVNSWGSDVEVFASTSAHEVSQWLCNSQAYGALAMFDGGYYLQLSGDRTIFQGKVLDQWIDQNRVGHASSVPAVEPEKIVHGVFRMGLPVYGESQSDVTTAITVDEGQINVNVLGTIRQGKSMLGKLSNAQRQELFRWMQDHPGMNGIGWPGWADTRVIVGNQRE